MSPEQIAMYVAGLGLPAFLAILIGIRASRLRNLDLSPASQQIIYDKGVEVIKIEINEQFVGILQENQILYNPKEIPGVMNFFLTSKGFEDIGTLGHIWQDMSIHGYSSPVVPEVLRLMGSWGGAGSPLEQFSIVPLIPMDIGHFLISFTNPSLSMLLTIGLVLLLFGILMMDPGAVERRSRYVGAHTSLAGAGAGAGDPEEEEKRKKRARAQVNRYLRQRYLEAQRGRGNNPAKKEAEIAILLLTLFRRSDRVINPDVLEARVLFRVVEQLVEAHSQRRDPLSVIHRSLSELNAQSSPLFSMAVDFLLEIIQDWE